MIFTTSFIIIAAYTCSVNYVSGKEILSRPEPCQASDLKEYASTEIGVLPRYIELAGVEHDTMVEGPCYIIVNFGEDPEEEFMELWHNRHNPMKFNTLVYMLSQDLFSEEFAKGIWWKSIMTSALVDSNTEIFALCF